MVARNYALVEARTYINAMMEKFRGDAFTKIIELTNACLECFTIEGEKYTFSMQQRTVRNQQGLVCILSSNDGEFNLEDNTGDGLIEVISFSLRLAIWMSQVEETDRTFLLDEPFAGVDKKRIPKIMEFLGNIADTFNIQFIIITHNPVIAECSDKKIQIGG